MGEGERRREKAREGKEIWGDAGRFEKQLEHLVGVRPVGEESHGCALAIGHLAECEDGPLRLLLEDLPSARVTYGEPNLPRGTTGQSAGRGMPRVTKGRARVADGEVTSHSSPLRGVSSPRPRRSMRRMAEPSLAEDMSSNETYLPRGTKGGVW